MTIVISNTTPIIGLTLLGQLELLPQIFGQVFIPTAVYNELLIGGANQLGVEEVRRGIAAGWLVSKMVAASDTLKTLKTDLDNGEAEAIALALELKADLILLDERKARAKAQALGLEMTGTIGVLILARAKGLLIDLPSALKQLRASGFRISEELYQQIIASTQE